MSQNSERQRSHAEADTRCEDSIFVLRRIRHDLGKIQEELERARKEIEIAEREMNQARKPLTEADFPEIGPFNTGELSKMLAGLTIRGDSEQDYPPADPEKVRHVDIGTGLDNLTAERGE